MVWFILLSLITLLEFRPQAPPPHCNISPFSATASATVALPPLFIQSGLGWRTDFGPSVRFHRPTVAIRRGRLTLRHLIYIRYRALTGLLVRYRSITQQRQAGCKRSIDDGVGLMCDLKVHRKDARQAHRSVRSCATVRG